jgi:predicted ATPase/signal transduction histidine kinase
MLVLDKVRKERARVSDIVLGPLSRKHLAALISDTLRCRREDAVPLVDLVYEKTAGNPFFAIQFLTTLHEERLIELDGRTGTWRWDVARIRAKGFTDNVVDLMVGKLVQFPACTQDALKQLASLGSSAEAAILAIAHGRSEDMSHADLWEAVRAGLVLRMDGMYKFLHDRVQEAAYSLIPEELRPEVHLWIGRRLLSRLPQEAIAERVFDIANQLNQGALIIADPREKETLCRLNSQAGRKAKASIAYASAQSYLAQATALLPADAWSTRYEETFALYMERVECEYLAGNFQRADALFDLILQNARSKLDRAKAYRLRMRLYQIAGRFGEAMAVMLEAMRLFGIALPESDEEIQAAAQAELRQVPGNLGGRRIAELVHAPMATDAEVRAIIGLLAEAMPLVYITRPELWPVITAKGVNLCLQRGHAEESPFVYSCYMMVLVSICGDIPSAFQFSEMALKLNEQLKGAAATLKGKLLFHHAAIANIWCRHFATSLPLLEQAFLACLDVGDLICAGYLTYNAVWLFLENGDPLDHVIEVARRYTAFAAQSHNDVVHNVVRLEEQFAASLKGATQAATSFSDDTFNEAECIAALEKAGFSLGLAYYHIMKQVAAFLDERYTEALEYAASAELMLRHVASMANEATHHFYHALTLTALHAQAPAEQQQHFARTLEQKLRKLKLWADHCPENFLNRYALVSAEVARIEGRALDAERLYEEAIRSAHANGFVHNEGLAHELASRFYRARGFDRIADLYLREARACYARWGADGKVKQIDQRNSHLFEPRAPAPTATFAAQPEQLDLLSVTKASQTISNELALDRLVRTLLTVVLEQGGAQRACLILCQGGSLSIEADATLEGEQGAAMSLLGPLPVDSSRRIPTSLVHYVRRTRERVILRDATADAGKFSGDDYFARNRPRSVLCMPILRQAEVVGLLYLENNLLAGAFTSDRLVALSLLATQAAISLEKAQLLGKERAARAAAEDAERRSAFIAEAGALLSESLDYRETLARLGRLCVRALADWCVIDILEGREIRRISGAHKEPAKEPLLEELQRRYPPHWGSPHPAATVLRTGEPLLFPELPEETLQGITVDEEHARLIRALGIRAVMAVPLVARGQTLGVLSLVSSAPGRRYGDADLELVREVARRAAIAIDNARLYRKTQEAIRVRDEFLSVASHELNTPITSLALTLQSMNRAIQSGRASDSQAMGILVERALRQGARLARLNSDLLDVSQSHAGRLPLQLTDVELGALVRTVVDHFQQELLRAGCSVSIHESGRLVGRWDRSRVDQILTNLLSNASKFGAGKPIEIFLGEEAGSARIAVRDHGIGIAPAQQDRIFERFERAASKNYGGLGLGLYISRQLAEAHGGSLRVQSQPGVGSTFILELPCAGPPPAPNGTCGKEG